MGHLFKGLNLDQVLRLRSINPSQTRLGERYAWDALDVLRTISIDPYRNLSLRCHNVVATSVIETKKGHHRLPGRRFVSYADRCI